METEELKNGTPYRDTIAQYAKDGIMLYVNTVALKHSILRTSFDV